MLAEDADFSVSGNASGTVVGFSFTGATIPASDGILVNLTYDYTGTYAFLGLDEVILSDRYTAREYLDERLVEIGLRP